MPPAYYDVVLVGDELAGMIAAALCARRGLRVLVVDRAARPAEPGAPSAFLVETSPAAKRVIAELNLLQAVKRRLMTPRPAFQLLSPDSRVDVSTDGELFARELDRELPDARVAIEAALNDAAEIAKVWDGLLSQELAIPGGGFWERRELKYADAKLPVDGKLLPTLPDGHLARAFLSLPAAFGLAVDPRAVPQAAALRHLDLWRRGAALLAGGESALRGLLVEKVTGQHSGEVRVLTPTGLTTRWGKVTALEVADAGEAISTGAVVFASPRGVHEHLLGDKAKRDKTFAWARQPSAWRVTFGVTLAASGLPEGLGQVAFGVVDPAKPLLDDNAIAIVRGEPDEDARVELAVSANLTAPADGDLEAAIRALRPRVLARLEDLLPFSTNHTLEVRSPALPDEPALSGPGIEPLWTPDEPLVLGAGALGYDAGPKGAIAATQQNLPGLGLEGAFAAGWTTARLVLAALGKRKDALNEVIGGTG